MKHIQVVHVLYSKLYFQSKSESSIATGSDGSKPPLRRNLVVAMLERMKVKMMKVERKKHPELQCFALFHVCNRVGLQETLNASLWSEPTV